MDFAGKQAERVSSVARAAGFAFSMLLSAAIMFLVLQFTHKFPEDWGYLHAVTIVGCIALAGKALRLWFT